MRRHWTRRDLLQVMGTGGALATASALLPSPLAGLGRSRTRRLVSSLDPTIVIDSTDVHTLAMRALDAAKAAGASYADVRLTRQLTQLFVGGGGAVGGSPFRTEGEKLGVGVRALVNGVWGFAASPYWEAEDVVRLAREAAKQARTNAQGAPTLGAWTPIPVASGSWKTPIKVDPFVLPLEEKGDLLETWCGLAGRYRIRCYCNGAADFSREERAVATTEGAYFTQTLYTSSGEFIFNRANVYRPGERQAFAKANGLVKAAVGWELLTEADIPGQIPRLYDEADPDRLGSGGRTGDIGRYDVVFDAATMASLVNATIGTAAQVDRALGYEANAGGTSYLGPDPLALLGSFQATSPLVNVTANRSIPRGLGTVKWDDEGVVPEDFTLIKDGVLVDYQTTREQAEWLAPWYQKQGNPVRSHGCAAANSALTITMQHTPNLVLEPGRQNLSFDDLVADTKKGLAVIGGNISTDFQARTGAGRGQIREIVNGKLGATVSGLECLFSTTQLWKNVKAVGGATSGEQFPSSDSKGEPMQMTLHSVRAVPAKIINMDFVDPLRKA